MDPLLLFEGCKVIDVLQTDKGIAVTIRTTAQKARCPVCGELSRHTYGSYVRRPKDLPVGGRAVYLELRVTRFRCLSATCVRRTFSVPPSRLLERYARRTARLDQAQSALGVALGGEAGGRLADKLHMPASADTLLRLVRRQPLALSTAPRVLGVDDFALRKGSSYGTIFVDLEKPQVVDMLPGRTAEVLAEWLRAHPGVGVVARDRSTEYAKGVSQGAPDAVQVADRWHLLHNLRQMLERWLGSVHARLRRLPPMSGDPSPQRERSFRRTQAEEAARSNSRAQRLANYEAVKRCHESGGKLLTIARELGLDVKTVRKYAYAETFPERSRRLWSSAIDPYLVYLEARHAEGCEDATQLWREIRQQGFPNSKRQVMKWLRERRRKPAPTTPGPFREPIRVELAEAAQKTALSPKAPPLPPLPGPKRLAWLCLQRPSTLSAEENEALERVRQDGEVAEVFKLASNFLAIVREQQTDQLDPWLSACEGSVKAVRTFAAGLKQDYAAVRAALTLPWSSGQTEGKINKLKFLKRQMFGRANFDLLRQRVLLAA